VFDGVQVLLNNTQSTKGCQTSK